MSDPQAVTSNRPPKATIFSRHSKECPRRDDRNWLRCSCPKWIDTYDPRTQQQGRESCWTRDLDEAEKYRQNWVSTHDPKEQEIRRLRAEKEAQTTTIEQAVVRFLASKRIKGVAKATMERFIVLLGSFNPETLGKLFEWLNQQNPRPVYVADLTPILVEDFIASWKGASDITRSTTFTTLKQFFSVA